MLPRVDLIRGEEHAWLLLNNNDHITEFIKKHDYWGRTESSIAKAFLTNRENTHVLDVGANLGGFSLPIGQFINKLGGKVYSFEPQRIVFQQLCANIFINRLDNVHTHNLALGDQDCEIAIPELNMWESQNVGGFSISQEIRQNLASEAGANHSFSNSETDNIFTISQKKLDSMYFDFTIDLIKVDIEGYEYEFFLGAQDTIIRSNYPPIIFELWEGKIWYEEKAQRTKQILTDLGYGFLQFGREILAQNPKHAVQCSAKREGNNVTLSLS